MAMKLDEVKDKIGDLVKKAKGLTAVFTGQQDLVAVDIGTHAVKVLELKREGENVYVRSWGHLPLNLKPEATPDERKSATINVRRAFLISKGVKIKEAATSISGNSV